MKTNFTLFRVSLLTWFWLRLSVPKSECAFKFSFVFRCKFYYRKEITDRSNQIVLRGFPELAKIFRTNLKILNLFPTNSDKSLYNYKNSQIQLLFVTLKKQLTEITTFLALQYLNRIFHETRHFGALLKNTTFFRLK